MSGKRIQQLKAKYIKAQQDYDKALTDYSNGVIAKSEVLDYLQVLETAWESYRKPAGLDKSIVGTLVKSPDGNISFDMYSSGMTENEFIWNLPEALEKAWVKIAPFSKQKLIDTNFFQNPHLQRLYYIYIKHGLLTLENIIGELKKALPDAKLEKAGNKFKPDFLNDKELKMLSNNISDHILSFLINWNGHPVRTLLKMKLKKKGLLLDTPVSIPALVFKTARILNNLGDDKSSFQRILSMTNHVPLTKMDTTAIKWLEKHSARRVRGLGERISDEVERSAEDRQAQIDKYTSMIQTVGAEAREKRWGWHDMASELGRRTGDWSRDWDRIARTELMEANLNAQANQYREKTPDGNPIVYKMPERKACKYCKALYLLDNDFDKPRLFYLNKLQDNGSNMGRKVVDWQPTLGTLHPNCNCTLHRFVGKLEGAREGIYNSIEPEVIDMPEIMPKEIADWWEKVYKGEVDISSFPEELTKDKL